MIGWQQISDSVIMIWPKSMTFFTNEIDYRSLRIGSFEQSQVECDVKSSSILHILPELCVRLFACSFRQRQIQEDCSP